MNENRSEIGHIVAGEDKLKRIVLMTGIILSIISKLLQVNGYSFWGNVLILPAAICFVLAILMYNKKYTTYWKNTRNKFMAAIFAISCCSMVLCFQVFTMLQFGYKNRIGLYFILPFLVTLMWNIYFSFKIFRYENQE